MVDRKNNQKKRWIWWGVAGVVLVVAVFIGWRIWQNRQNASAVLSNLNTEPYQRMTLNASIFGTGSVVPAQSAMLTWSASGVVGEVHVSLNEQVSKDDVLMTLDPDSVTVDVLQAEIEVINARNALKDLYDNAGAELAQARLDLLLAQDNLDDLEIERTIMNYQRCTDERIEDLEEQVDQAEFVYKYRQNADTLRAVNIAQANLNYCRADYTEQEVAQAQLKVELAEARVANLEERVDLLSDGPDPDQVRILETQLAIAQARLDSIQVKAPFAGVVTVLPVQEGDVVQVGRTAAQLDDLSSLYLDVLISEVDIPQVAVGQPAELVFDAYFETTFNGEVTEIAPVGNSVQGVVEYAVRIALLDGDERIKPGMTAAVNIIVDRKEAVLVVPNDAVVMLDNVEHVFVRRNGAYVAVPVELGSYSDYYSEVLAADIAEGELVVLNPPNSLTGASAFGRPPSGPFGGFGQ